MTEEQKTEVLPSHPHWIFHAVNALQYISLLFQEYGTFLSKYATQTTVAEWDKKSQKLSSDNWQS